LHNKVYVINLVAQQQTSVDFSHCSISSTSSSWEKSNKLKPADKQSINYIRQAKQCSSMPNWDNRRKWWIFATFDSQTPDYTMRPWVELIQK